ncbi:MAG: MdtA/MuxA family multidrug efflux RND transporter periplasmic adaptor subunit [Nevskiaceae bacterium]|nr:MAG: MdtA/MuxA family multidrug efflux RND transporter periplasmic adaptor subunit [Nevskiaceae bacterium]
MAETPQQMAPRARRQFTGGRSRVWLLLPLAVVVAAAWIVWSAQHRSATGGDRRGAFGKNGSTVGVAAARSGDINVYLNALGTVTPLATVTVRPRVDGQLMSLDFREGQTVAAGAVLAQIDPRPFEVQRQQAEGQLARDQAQLDTARIDLDRYRTLFEQDSIAKQQVDQQASLVKQYEAAVKSDQAALDSARLNLTYARVTAPVSGRIGLRQVDVGNIVSSSATTGVAVITQMKPITVLFSLPEDNLPDVLAQSAAGKLAVDVYDRAQKIKLASGTLSTIDNQIDTTTGAVKLRASFANDNEVLFPNQFVNVRMLLKVEHGVILIPSAALLQGTGGPYVYVLNADSTVSVRKVQPGVSEGETTAIDSGLQAGEQVVTDGVDKLRDGASVTVAGAAAATGPGTSAKTPDAPARASGDPAKDHPRKTPQ